MKPIQTSASHPLTVDFLISDLLQQPGRIGMTMAPGKQDEDADTVRKRDLQSDLKRLRQHYGIDRLVCLLEGNELNNLAIPDLLSLAKAYGMAAEHLPTSEVGLPDSMAAFSELVDKLVNAVRSKESVLIHCNGGQGRTGMLAACCLVRLGYSPADAITTVQRVRDGALASASKRDYVHRFHETHKQP